MESLTAGIAYFTLGVVLLWIFKRTLVRDRLGHLPGPNGLPVFGSIFDIDKGRLRISLHKWARQYGGVYRVRLAIDDVIVVSRFQYIHHVLVSSGKAFAGRKSPFRQRYIDGHQSVSFMQPTDPSWSLVRKLSHRYLKQFGEGRSRLETVLSASAQYLLRQFDSCVGQPVDVMQIIKITSLTSISVLLLGRALDDDDPLLGMLLKYEEDFWNAVGTSPGSMILEIFPFLIHLPIPASRHLNNFNRLQDQCWERIKAMQSKAKEESLTQVLLECVSKEKTPDSGDKDWPAVTGRQAAITSIHMIIAGTATTARALYCILNVLAFRQDIQEAVYAEICNVFGREKSQITVDDRPRMPYLGATILECLRAFPPAPYFGIPHVPLNDATIPDYGVIPKGTLILINTWALHHDETFWDNPEIIRPERFLDPDGQLLPPDHPNRKRVLPFGAGPRICVGEVFARTRLFLWTAAVINTFKLKPAPGSDEKWLRPDIHLDNMILAPLPNQIVFSRRN